MTLEERTRLSYYQEMAPLNAAHGVMLVRHSETGLLYVKKTLSNYQLSIFERLKARPFEGMPQVIEAVEDGGQLIVIETYLSGRDLQELLDEQGPFPADRVREIGLTLCRILVPLHGAGIVHRDIKPSNVIQTAGGAVMLLDLDAAKVWTQGEVRDTRLIGTKGYAAPEQYGFGASTPATDIYALGVLMNVLLTGEFPGTKLPEDPQLRAVVQRCTRLEPAERFASAGELAGALLGMESRPAGAPEGVGSAKQGERPYKGPARYSSEFSGSTNAVPAAGRTDPAPVTGVRRFLPPGFRSGNLRNMLLASLYYVLMIAVVVRGAQDDIALADKITLLFFTVAAFLGLPAIFYNYLGLQDRLGISRLEPKNKRVWACIGAYTVFLIIIVAVGKVIQMIFRGA